MRLDSLLNRGKPVLVTLGYHRCPMLCGLVLDGLVKAEAASGLKLGKDFFALDVSIDPAEDATLLAQTQKRVLTLAGSNNAADWPFWSSSATAAPRRASSPTRSASATSTTRRASSSRTTQSRSC